MEPQWRMLLFAFAGRIRWRYRMGAMIGDWEAYNDPVNSVHRAGQMAPVWLEAAQVSGMPVDPGIWLDPADRPASSLPACLAVKAAELQSAAAGSAYLRRLREAVMTERRNIARHAVLVELAEECAATSPAKLDAGRLSRDLVSCAVRSALHEDVVEAHRLGISRFPALAVRGTAQPTGVVLVGWRPFDALAEVVRHAAPEIGPVRRPVSRDEYGSFWPGSTERELSDAGPPSDP